MGLPEIIIEFKTKGVTAIKRSARGIVAIVLKDDTEEGQALNIYKSVLDVDPTHFTARNYEYLKLVYEGSPSKTIVLKVGTAVENLNPQLKQLNDLKWNYLVIPGITDDEKTTVSAWIKEARDDHHKTFKAVLPNCTADHEGIINLTTDNITSTLVPPLLPPQSTAVALLACWRGCPWPGAAPTSSCPTLPPQMYRRMRMNASTTGSWSSSLTARSTRLDAA